MSSIAAIEEYKGEFTDADLDAHVLDLLSYGALVQSKRFWVSWAASLVANPLHGPTL
jgi:hypothetical protein